MADYPEYLEHITLPGDRWDLIAYRYYGEANLLGIVIEANEQLAITPVLPTGVLVLVPVIAAEVLPTNAADMPPWKR